MPDLRVQLRDYVEANVERVDIDDLASAMQTSPKGRLQPPGRVRRRWFVRARPVVIAGATAVIVVVLVGGAWLLTAGGEDSPVVTQPVQPSSTVPQTTTSPAPTTTEPEATVPEAVIPASLTMTWERLPRDPIFEDAWITRVTVGGPGLVAVGYVREEPWPADWHSDAAVWVSPNGVDWERTSDPAVFSVTGEFTGRDEFLHDVSAGPDGITVYGQADYEDAQWTSSDGTSWTRPELGISSSGPATRPQGEVYDIIAGGPGFVAVGRTDPPDPTGAIWVSADGLEWQRVAEEQSEIIRQFEHVTSDPNSTRILAFGWDKALDTTTTLYSDDGLTWASSHAPQGAPPPGSRAAWSSDRLVVVGMLWGNAPGIWVSDDGGATLYRLDTDTPAFLGTTPDISGVVLFGSQYIAVGGDRGSPLAGQLPVSGGGPMNGGDARGAIWIGEWDDS
jgi:hypothetical protein